MAEPNPFINQAVSAMRSQTPEWQNLAMEALDQAASTPWGQAIIRHNPDFGRVRSELTGSGVTHEERIKMISDTEGLHTFAGIITEPAAATLEISLSESLRQSSSHSPRLSSICTTSC